MEIFTSYFGNSKALNRENVLMIGISRFPPAFFRGNSMMELAPYSNMLKMDPEEYDIAFAKILSKLDQHEIVKKIAKIAKTYEREKVALCCFEKKQIECHRYNVAMWLNEKGYNVKEFEAKPLYIQTSLF